MAESARANQLRKWPRSTLHPNAGTDAELFETLLQVSKLDDERLTARQRARLRSDLERAATALRSCVAAEKHAIPSLVGRDLENTASAARRLFARLNDLDSRASGQERQARIQVIGLLGEAWDRRGEHAKGRDGLDLSGFEVVTNAVRLIAELASEADGLLEKSTEGPKHEAVTARREVAMLLAEAWERATGKPMSTKPRGPSGRFLAAFFKAATGSTELTIDQRRLLLREIRSR